MDAKKFPRKITSEIGVDCSRKTIRWLFLKSGAVPLNGFSSIDLPGGALFLQPYCGIFPPGLPDKVLIFTFSGIYSVVTVLFHVKIEGESVTVAKRGI